MFWSTNNKIIIKKHFLKEYLPEILFTRIYLGEKCKYAVFLGGGGGKEIKNTFKKNKIN